MLSHDLYGLIHLAFNVVYLLVLARAVISWFPSPGVQYHPISLWLHRVVDPMLRPFRRMLSPYQTGGLDFSPLLLLVTIVIAQRILLALLGH